MPRPRSLTTFGPGTVASSLALISSLLTCITLYQQIIIRRLREKNAAITREHDVVDKQNKKRSNPQKVDVNAQKSRGKYSFNYQGNNSSLPSQVPNIITIGKIKSIYRLCVGTPRQGLLAPNSRGLLRLDTSLISPASLDSLSEYSHLWIFFLFHLNTESKGRTKKNATFPAKIRPPALGGTKKVGIFSTRTPHRPNPIGVTLCRIASVDVNRGFVHLEGVDLVDGTPVLDMKPYVAAYDFAESSRIPKWVEDGLGRRRHVTWSDCAINELQHLVTNGRCSFYEGREWEKMKLCVEEVLRVDVRSVYQTKKARKGEFRAERCLKHDGNDSNEMEGMCTQQLDNLLIWFSIQSPIDMDNGSIEAGSGGKDVVYITSISHFNDPKPKFVP